MPVPISQELMQRVGKPDRFTKGLASCSGTRSVSRAGDSIENRPRVKDLLVAVFLSADVTRFADL